MTEEEIKTFREKCPHAWIPCGAEQESAAVMRIFHYCMRCSSYTYLTTKFIGYQLDNLDAEESE